MTKVNQQKNSDVPDDIAFKPTDDQIDFISNKLKAAMDGGLCMPSHTMIINGIMIDLENMVIRRGSSQNNRTAILFDRPIFEQWTSGTISFKEAMDSNRFALYSNHQRLLAVLYIASKIL